MADDKFGRYLIQQGLAKAEQIDECLRLQQQMAADGVAPIPPLAELLVRKGYLTTDQAARTLKLTRAPAPPPGDRRGGTQKLEEPPLPPEAAGGEPVGKYLKTRRLGAGGMGEVWKAYDRELHRWVAMKFLKHEDAEEIARFKREAQTAGRLNHPNIAAIHEVGEIGGKHFIAMQFVEGQTLAKFPRQNVRLLVELMRDAALAVHAAHEEGIVHRDLKPDNLMVESKSKQTTRTDRVLPGTPRPSSLRLYVMDFGLAKSMIVDSSLSQSGLIVGTAPYMSPEQASGRRRLDARTDVYSLGATLYELLAGRPPFVAPELYALLKRVMEDDPPPLRGINPGLDSDLETIVLKCLEKDPARRYPTAHELADDLSRWLSEEAILAHPPSMVYRARKFVARRKAATLGLLAVLVLAATSAIVLPQLSKESAARKQRERELGEERESKLKRAEAAERARSHLEAGRRLIEQMRLRQRKDYKPQDLAALAEEATAEFKKALEQTPDDPDAWLGIGTAWGLAKSRSKSLSAIDEAIRASPAFATAYLDRVRLRIDEYLEMRQDQQGATQKETLDSGRLRDVLKADLGKVQQYAKDTAERLYAEAMMAFADGEFERATKTLAEHLRTSPGDGRAHLMRGTAFYHLRRLQEAEHELSEAIECDRGDVTAYINRGNVRDRTGDFQRAIEDYGKAIACDPENATAYYNRGLARGRKSDLPGAIQDYSKALEFAPRDARIYVNRGVARSEAGSADEAIRDFTQAISIDPGLSLAHFNRGLELQKKGDVEGALKDFSRAIEIDPMDPTYHAGRGAMRRLKGDMSGAISDCSRAIEIDPKCVPAYENRARARSRNGDLEGAVQDYSKLIEMNPRNLAAYDHRAVARGRLGDLEGEIADCTKALEIDAKDTTAYINRSGARLRLGKDLAGAISDCTRILEIDPKDPDAYFNRGAGHEMLAERGEGIAKEHLESARQDAEKALSVASEDWGRRPLAEDLLARVRKALAKLKEKR